MRWLALAALCGCNQIFGLEKTRPDDAPVPFFDAPIDAPFACPSFGGSFELSPLLHQISTQQCSNYSESRSAKLVVALCNGVVSEATLADSNLALASDFTASTLSGQSPQPYPIQIGLSPEGDELWIVSYSFASAVSVYRRVTGAWQWQHDLQPPPESFANPFSLATHGPARRFLVGGISGGANLFEREAAPDGSVTLIHTYAYSDLGVSNTPDAVALASDGLRLLLYSSMNADQPQNAYYTDRSDLSSLFRTPAVAVASAPLGLHPFITDDCARVYVDGLSYVFYAQQK